MDDSGKVVSGGVELYTMHNPVNDLFRAYRDTRFLYLILLFSFIYFM